VSFREVREELKKTLDEMQALTWALAVTTPYTDSITTFQTAYDAANRRALRLAREYANAVDGEAQVMG
jgi:hypothetical protein